ncbi:glycosyltransferase family 4 protein [Formosa maritima]|uniref:Glycosyltransferase family 4 protein n=1 Tax=Formosa maritima TaxID=2592046 RepID=A0A5D0GFT9_9FLAO|nr:glycosyltransferase family 4 protein [Formosa maritima]TYA56667.1 glycosyltransferase family 4 protein [Formosa maritima]
MNKKILIVTSEFPPQPGGIGYHAFHVAEQLQMHGYGVTVLADQRSKSGEEEMDFDKSLKFGVKRVTWKSIRMFMYLNRLILLFRLIKSNEVVLASGKFSLWMVAFVSLFYKKKYLAVIHGSEVNFKKQLLKKSVESALKQFSTIIAVSQYTESLISHLNLNTIVIPNGYDTKKWRTEIQAYQNLKGYPKLMTLGNVTTRKGQLQVIKHLPKLLEYYPEIQYHCVGLPTEAKGFSQVAVDLGVDKQVHFHGRLEDTKLQAMLMAMDVFVMLSKETETGDVEGFGMALMEANALGIPTIGSKGCGIEDAILDGKSGCLVAAESVSEFQEALYNILELPEVFKAEAKLWAETHTWEEIIKQYIRHMEI